MSLRISGKNLDVGEALRGQAEERVAAAVSNYYEGGYQGHVTVDKDGTAFRTDGVLHLSSGITLEASATAHDAYASLDKMAERIEKRLRRYKRRLKDHHIGPKGLSPEKTEDAAREVARSIVLRDPDTVEDEDFGDAGEADGPPPVGMVIAETQSEIRTITVGRAVAELDMTGYPVVLFRNAAHGGLSVVYRRPDGNVGWIDPERTVANGHANGNGSSQ